MKYDNLSHHDKRVYNRAILATHRRRIEVRVFTLDDVFVQSFTPRFLSGEVTIDTSTSPSRVATFELVEPTQSLVFEPQDSSGSSLHRSYKIEVIDSRQIMELDGEWVEQAVIYGPIWDFTRQGASVHLEVDGTDRLAMGTIRKAKAWTRKTKKTDIIRGLLVAAGSRRNKIPDLPQTTHVHVHVGVTHHERKGKDGKMHHATQKHRKVRGFTTHRTDTYLGKADQLATSENRHLYADAEGVFRMRLHPTRPAYHFGPRSLLSEPSLDRAGRDGPNTWVVIGSKPKGSRRRVSSGLVGFPHDHPLSAYELAWHGEPYQILAEDSNPHVKTKAKAKAIAKRRRNAAAAMLVEVSIEAMPIPWLIAQEGNLVACDTPWGVPDVQMTQVTYPLTPDNAPMTIGSTRRAVPKLARFRSVGVS